MPEAVIKVTQIIVMSRKPRKEKKRIKNKLTNPKEGKKGKNRGANRKQVANLHTETSIISIM